MAASGTAPLLDLDTLAEQPTIAIDGTAYRLALPDTLSLIDYRNLANVLPRLEDLWRKARTEGATLTKAEDDDLHRAFRQVCTIILDAPRAVHDKLSDLQRVAIYQVFLTLPSATLRRMVAFARPRTAATADPTTGASSSPASVPATKAPRRGPGSTTRRTASSGPV